MNRHKYTAMLVTKEDENIVFSLFDTDMEHLGELVVEKWRAVEYVRDILLKIQWSLDKDDNEQTQHRS